METHDLAAALPELVEAAAAGELGDDDAHVIGSTLVLRYPGRDLTVRAARRRVVALADGEPITLDRADAQRIAAALPEAIAITAVRRADVAERSVHVRLAPRRGGVAIRDERVHGDA